MGELPKISESEPENMKEIWKRSPITAEQIAIYLSDSSERSDQAVR
ncbi:MULTISPECIES: hypothetical protein [Brevibacillus]|nr:MULTISPECIES: hypothetical protein [Brevibacillus]MBU8713983.1 hypothetical protein [Brevibacillus parabrevis]MDH6350549.1 putative transcriptional regulator [Brevibacillus sp. 1238]MDR4998396.1 hypothetical protein [Brevibacillus parabrevis]UED68228.1 hypothetical protein HP435_23705 [Brevibacillus sp. HD3.3A]